MRPLGAISPDPGSRGGKGGACDRSMDAMILPTRNPREHYFAASFGSGFT